MKRPIILIASGSCLLALLATVAPAGSGPAAKADPPAGQAARPAAAPDEAAIRAQVAEFARAFNAGDAPALAALFTEQARVTTVSGQRIDGRAAIEKLFATAFEESPGQAIDLKTEAIRLLGPEAAIEEGSATITSPADAGGDARPSSESTHYTAAYVKRDGKWLQDSIRDYPIGGDASAGNAAHEHLKALEGLVGEWLDESDDAEVQTTCRWTENGSFLLRAFSMKVRGKEAMTGSQRVGWDPRLKQIRSWVFDSDGGFSDGFWSQDGDRWIIKSQGVLKDGRTASATNVLTFVNRDTLRWASVDRTIGGEIVPDAEEITLVRKPPAPRSSQPVAKPVQPGSTRR